MSQARVHLVTARVNRTPSHVTFFSCFSALITMSHVTLAQGVSARHPLHVSCACVSDLSSTLPFALFTVSPIFYFILLIFHFVFYVGPFGVKPPCALPRMRSLAPWSTTPLSQLEQVCLRTRKCQVYRFVPKRVLEDNLRAYH